MQPAGPFPLSYVARFVSLQLLLPQVTAGHLEAAFRETRPSLSASDVTFYAAVYDAFARPAVALKRAQRATLA